MKARPYAEALGTIRGRRRGITTGTCAQAAARAAALALAAGASGNEVEVELPHSARPYSRARIVVPLSFARREGKGFRVGVKKDAGDDDDVTDGLVVEALVGFADSPGIEIEGGAGVGRVTRPGLPVARGLAAINPTPRAMIRRDLEAIAPAGRGFSVLIEIPGGEAVAARTWNPRIGVEGGLSVIGTSGVVEPKSTAAFRKTIVRAARAMAARGLSRPYLTPGYVGEAYLHSRGARDEDILVVGDHVGLGLRALTHYGASRILLVGHAGKLVKIAAGIFNTHSRFGDARLETLAALAAAEGAERSLVSRLLELGTAEEASRLILEAGFGAVFAAAARRAADRSRILAGIPVEVIMLALDGSVLGASVQGASVLDAGALTPRGGAS